MLRDSTSPTDASLQQDYLVINSSSIGAFDKPSLQQHVLDAGHRWTGHILTGGKQVMVLSDLRNLKLHVNGLIPRIRVRSVHFLKRTHRPYGGITNKPSVFNDFSPDYTSRLKAGVSCQTNPEAQPSLD